MVENLRIMLKISTKFLFNEQQKKLVIDAVFKAKNSNISNYPELLDQINSISDAKSSGDLMVCGSASLNKKVIEMRKELNLPRLLVQESIMNIVKIN